LPKTYEKPPLSIEEQLELLERRGMVIRDCARAKHYLSFISYYRLAGYWFPFQYRDDSAVHDNFRQGTTFEVVLDRYVFDRQLRVLIMDAIERIEVAARTAISNTMCTILDKPHWYLEPCHFIKEFDHSGFLKRVEQEMNKQKKDKIFISHYLETYENPPELPSWAVFEILPFGTVSRVFAVLRLNNQRAIAELFDLTHKTLKSWLHAACYLRNLCAHHSRVWNRTFRVTPSTPKSMCDQITKTNCFYRHAIAIQILLKRVSGNTDWADHLQTLLEKHPNIPPDLMGFPDDWRQKPVWRAKTT